jgi:phenylacetate-CoA ligase
MGSVSHPFQVLAKKCPFPKYWNEKIETMPEKELKKLQEEKLRAQLKYVYEKCSFYHRRFKESGIYPDDIKTIEDLRKLPFLTKEDERRLQDKMRPGAELGEHQTVPIEQIVRIHSTSGTTGRPVYFGYTNHDLEVWTEGDCSKYLLYRCQAWRHCHVWLGLRDVCRRNPSVGST